MKIAEKFGRLLARLWPFWLPLLLLFALPLTRPFGRIASDDVVDAMLEMVSGQRPDVAVPAAATHPGDFDLLIWGRWNNHNDNINYYTSGEESLKIYDELVKLRRQFPDEPLLIAPPIQHQLGLPSFAESYYNYGPASKDPSVIARELKMLREFAQRGIKLEPDNAFWWVSLTWTNWRAKRYDTALDDLERAAKCSRYDDYTLELARRLVSARKRYGAPTFFEKLAILEDVRSADQGQQNNMAAAWGAHAVRLRVKGDKARALRWASALLVAGDLMQRDPNAWATVKAGLVWQNEGYRVGTKAKINSDSRQNARAFAVFARANGRTDLAQLAPQLAARSQQIQSLSGKNSGRYSEMIWLRHGQLDRWVNLLEGLPIVMAANLIYLALWWLSANLFLWRARAVPSSRRERFGLASATMLPLLVLGALGIWGLIALDGTQKPLFPALAGSALVFAFCGAPFVLALCCALVTMRRHRARFTLPPRIDTEMSLTNPSRAFLRWFLPACVAGSVAFLLLSWATWLLATARNWASVDLLALLPPDRRGFTNSLIWDSTGPTILVYAVLLCVLCLLIWFGRWRWTMPAALRPLTQGALRWWKETLGAAIVILSWFGLLLALGSVPIFHQADARLERVLKAGDLQVAQSDR